MKTYTEAGDLGISPATPCGWEAAGRFLWLQGRTEARERKLEARGAG